MSFSLGDRVRITDETHWAHGATGTITEPPELARAVGPGWNEFSRPAFDDENATVYWVKFDTPQTDPEDETEYDGAEVNAKCMDILHPS